MKRLIQNTLIFYITGLIVWVISRALTHDGTLYVLILDYLGVWLFFPLLFYIPWVFINRNKFGALLLVMPVGLFVWLYGIAFLPKNRQIIQSEFAITVISFNMHGLSTDLNAFLGILNSYPSEVLALQEVTVLTMNKLHNSLTESHPYQTYDWQKGLAVYSKYPILDNKDHYSNPWPYQSIIIDVRGNPLLLVNAHLARIGFLMLFESWNMNVIREAANARSEQITRIRMLIDEHGLPAIVACDCNMTDLTASYRQMTANLLDAYSELGLGFGHTFLVPRGFEIKSKINLPFQRIDYLFYSKDINVLEVKIIADDIGSDHRLIWAQFDLEKPMLK